MRGDGSVAAWPPWNLFFEPRIEGTAVVFLEYEFIPILCFNYIFFGYMISLITFILRFTVMRTKCFVEKPLCSILRCFELVF